MSEKCQYCDGELIIGQMAGSHGVFFYPEGETSKLMPKRSKVVCYCCKKCGAIQNIKAIELDKLK